MKCSAGISDFLDEISSLSLSIVFLYFLAVIRTIPRKKKHKKAKWLSEKALQIVEKRSEAKSKGEKEKYKHVNAEIQRIARRDKKAFLRD